MALARRKRQHENYDAEKGTDHACSHKVNENKSSTPTGARALLGSGIVSHAKCRADDE